MSAISDAEFGQFKATWCTENFDANSTYGMERDPLKKIGQLKETYGQFLNFHEARQLDKNIEKVRALGARHLQETSSGSESPLGSSLKDVVEIQRSKEMANSDATLKVVTSPILLSGAEIAAPEIAAAPQVVAENPREFIALHQGQGYNSKFGWRAMTNLQAKIDHRPKVESSYSLGQLYNHPGMENGEGIMDRGYVTKNGRFAYVYDSAGHGNIAENKKLEPIFSEFNQHLETLSKKPSLFRSSPSLAPLVASLSPLFKKLEEGSLDGAFALTALVTYQNSQHALILAAGDSQVAVYDKNGIVVFLTADTNGSVFNLKETSLHLVKLQKGDKIVLYTDGIGDFINPKKLLEPFNLEKVVSSQDIINMATLRLTLGRPIATTSKNAEGIEEFAENEKQAIAEGDIATVGPEAGLIGKKQWKADVAHNYDDMTCAVINVIDTK